MMTVNAAADLCQKRYNMEPRNQLDPRRSKERADARMIYEDHRAMANLPGEPVYHLFPESDRWNTGAN